MYLGYRQSGENSECRCAGAKSLSYHAVADDSRVTAMVRSIRPGRGVMIMIRSLM